MLYVWELNVRSYYVLTVLAIQYLAQLVVYREWVNLVTVSACWFCEHPYRTDRGILLFLFLLTNVLIVNRFGLKRLPNALKVTIALFPPTVPAQLASTRPAFLRFHRQNLVPGTWYFLTLTSVEVP